MKKVVTQIEESKVEVLVTVEEKQWEDAQKKAYKAIADNVTVKGFRKGHVPENMLKGKIDEAQVFDKAINAILPELYNNVLTEEKLQPFTNPNVEVAKLNKKELEVKFTIITMPKVTLGKYKGLHVEKAEVKVSEEEIDEAIKKLLENNANLVVKEGTSEMGDTVVIDFEGFVDEKPFEGGKAENYELVLGSHSFIPGFEEQLVGHKAEEDVTVNVKFPEAYVPELAGKDAVFKCKLHEVKTKVLQELNEEFVADLALEGVKTVEELKENQKKNIEGRKLTEANNEHFEKLLGLIRDEAEINIAAEIVDNEVNSMEENFKNQISQNGLTLEQYLQITNSNLEDMRAKMRLDAEKNLRSFLVLEQIGFIEGLEASDSDVEEEFNNIAKQYSMDVAKVKEILGKDIEKFKRELRQRRITKFIIDNNK